MPFSHPSLEVARLIYPGPCALHAIEQKPKARTFSLSDLPAVKGLCVWCNSMPITPPRRRYCSQDCVDSATLFCHPQSPRSKMYVLLQLQDCTCVGCGEIFDELVTDMINRRLELQKNWNKNYSYQLEPEKVSLAMLGDCTGHIWEVDHIIPIFRGGRGVGIENIQVLCVNCHRKKTARERRTA